MVQILVAHLAPVSVHVHRLNFNISFFLQQNLHSLEVHTQIKKNIKIRKSTKITLNLWFRMSLKLVVVLAFIGSIALTPFSHFGIFSVHNSCKELQIYLLFFRVVRPAVRNHKSVLGV